MGILDRLRGVETPDEGVRELQEAIGLETSRLRVPLYSDAEKIGTTFAQRGPNVIQSVTGGELSLEVGGGYMALASVKGGAKRVSNQTIEITPMVQTLMLSEGATKDGTMVDLASRGGHPGDMLVQFVGRGRLFGPREPVTASLDLSVSEHLAAEVQARREQQEERLRWTDPELPGTIVWLATGVEPLASIASLRGASAALSSYMPTGNYGVLGLFEDRLGTLTLVTPLMIWHHAGAGF